MGSIKGALELCDAEAYLKKIEHDMCLMNIRNYSEQGADSSWCAICKDQWEAMYEAYKDAIQETIP